MILANLESYNAVLISEHKLMSERIVLLRKMVQRQMKSLESLSLESRPILSLKDNEKESGNG